MRGTELEQALYKLEFEKGKTYLLLVDADQIDIRGLADMRVDDAKVFAVPFVRRPGSDAPPVIAYSSKEEIIKWLGVKLAPEPEWEE